MMIRSIFFLASCLAIANAAVTVTSPFTGTVTETFETDVPGSRPNPLAIFGGLGSITDTRPYIYSTNGNGFGLAACSAKVHDGSNGFGHDTSSGNTTFNFPTGIPRFGGYFAYAYGGSPAQFIFYSDAGSTVIGTINFSYDARAQNCELVFFGVTSTVPIKRIDFISYYGVFDSLTADFSVCGNGIVETGEQCDGGSCCTSTCTFALPTQVCRPAVDGCDFAESCTGASASCPADVVNNNATCFCARKGLTGNNQGYYCDAYGGYYQCVGGDYASQSSERTCAPGTRCGCDFGVECSCGGTRSPCVFPTQYQSGTPVQNCS